MVIDLAGVIFLPASMIFNGVSAPADDALLTIDDSDKELLMTNMNGKLLNGRNLTQNEPSGIVLIGSDPCQIILPWPIRVMKEYILDLNGVTQTSFPTSRFIERPAGLEFIERRADGKYDNHLLISSHVDDNGSADNAWKQPNYRTIFVFHIKFVT